MDYYKYLYYLKYQLVLLQVKSLRFTIETNKILIFRLIKDMPYVFLIVFLIADWRVWFLKFFVPLENFSLIWRRHHCWWRAANFDPCSALMAIEQWGFFTVPHLLWHGASAYSDHLRGPVAIKLIAHSNPLRHRCGSIRRERKGVKRIISSLTSRNYTIFFFFFNFPT